MALATTVKKDEVLTINGVRIKFQNYARVVILDQATVVFPNGKENPGSRSEEEEAKRILARLDVSMPEAKKEMAQLLARLRERL